MNKIKVALVHDYIKEYGGAERVLETLHEIFPEAPVFTLVYLPQFLGPHRERFENWKIHTSWLQYVPFNQKLISPFRLIAPFVFKSMDLSEFDVVVVSATGAYAPNMVSTKKNNVITKNIVTNTTSLRGEHDSARRSNLTDSVQPRDCFAMYHMVRGFAHNMNKGSLAMTSDNGAIHICYCHTPPRYLYGYATAREWKKNIFFRILGEVVNHFLRMVDYNSSKKVDYFIANSKEVRARIKKFYRREAVVIYPPADVNIKYQKFQPKVDPPLAENIKKNKGEYYLTGGRLARPKHIDLIVKACMEMGVPLKVFGRGFAGYERELRNLIYRHSGERGTSDSRIDNENDSGQARMTKDNIKFLGEVSDEEKRELMRGARAFIFASEDEDFGIVPVEAMSQGTPVIAYKSGGVKETVSEGVSGLFFEKLTVDSLKEVIRKFGKIRIYPENCIKQAEKFSKKEFMRKISELLALNLQNCSSNIKNY